MDLWYQIRRVAHLTPVQIDGWVFRLHYWVTSTGILAASAVAFAKQYFGDPIITWGKAVGSRKTGVQKIECKLCGKTFIRGNCSTKARVFQY